MQGISLCLYLYTLHSVLSTGIVGASSRPMQLHHRALAFHKQSEVWVGQHEDRNADRGIE